MKVFFFSIIMIMIITSCSFSFWKEVTVTIEPHPFEEASGHGMWYIVRYFNGKEVISETLSPWTRNFRIRILAGGLRPIAVYPLGSLSPLGGFYEPGSGSVVLKSADGPFASLLINASEYRPEAVSSLSISWLRRRYWDLSIIDQESFLQSLFDGTVSYEKIELSKLFHPSLEMLPSGHWISDSDRADSFTISSSGEALKMPLFSGSYSFWNMERSLLFTIIIVEDGRYYTKMENLTPFWL